MSSVAVTGANGFVGTHLCSLLEEQGRRVVRISRGLGDSSRSSGDSCLVRDLTDSQALAEAFRGVDAVVHLAARAHVLRETVVDSQAEFDRINVDGTCAVCMAAVRAGVHRIVFVSSVGVNGDRTYDRPFVETDIPNPTEPYAQSKWKAECLLWEHARAAGFEAVVIRPSLVYGRGVKGNFLRLLRLASLGLPLPLASIHNLRSLLNVRNLCDLLVSCLDSPVASGQTYLAADAGAHSTPELLERISWALGRRGRLFSFPERVLACSARALGFGKTFDKLCSSLEVCADKARRELGWVSRVSFDDGIADTVTWYQERYLGTR